MNDQPQSTPPDNLMWRFQSAPMKHLGLTPDNVLSFQKSPITGAGRLTPIHLHLVAELASGRIIALATLPKDSDPFAFLARALREAATLGGLPRNLVFSREAARTAPKLLTLAADAGVASVFATQAFKLRQKISRHFEDFLFSRIIGHASLAKWENFQVCFPSLVAAWNVDGQVAMDERPSRYAIAAQAVEAQLGPDPRAAAEREFQQRRIEIANLDVQPGVDPGFCFRDTYGAVAVYFGFDLRFVARGIGYQVPLFAAPALRGAERTLRNLDPNRISFRKGDVPVELRSAWHIEEKKLDQLHSLRDFLLALAARDTAFSDIAGLLRKLVAVWHNGPEPRGFQRFGGAAAVQPTAAARSAGINFSDESWERIRGRHFWRVIALWHAGFARPLPVARVQIESNGRLNVLPLNSLFSDTSSGLNELVRSLFLEGKNVVSAEERHAIKAQLHANAAARITGS